MADDMAPGGIWLSEGGGAGTPHYVVNPDHVARLQREGYQPVVDPRIPADEPKPENDPEKEEEDKHDDTNGRIAAIKPAHKSSKGSVDVSH